MAAFEWRKYSTKYFGEVWAPFAQIQVRTALGSWQPIVVQVDSGAVVSLLRRSAAELMGISLESGRSVTLSSEGDGTSRAFVHEIPIRLDESMECTLPFAFSESETVPNLLGRLGVFEYYQIVFDPVRFETRIFEPE